MNPILEVPFFGGINEDPRTELVDAAKEFATLENGRQERSGGYTKRQGFAALTSTLLDGTTRSTGLKLFARNGTPCVIDGSYRVQSYNEELDRWVDHGRGVSEVTYAFLDTPSSVGSGDGVVDIAGANDCIALATVETDGIYVSVQSSADGRVLRAPERLAAGSTAALASYSDRYIIALVLTVSSGNIAAWYLDTNTAASLSTGWVSMGNVIADHYGPGASAEALALSTESLTNRIAVAYVNDSSGTSRLTVTTLTIAGVSETATVNTSSTRPTGVAVAGSIADTLWIAWNESTDVKVQGRDADSLSTTLATTTTVFACDSSAPTVLAIGAGVDGAGTGRIYVNDDDSPDTFLRFRRFATSGGAVTITSGEDLNFIFGIHIASRILTRNSRYYALCCPDNNDTPNAQKRMILCDLTDAHYNTGTPATFQLWLRPVANLAPGIANTTAASRAHFVETDDGRYLSPIRITRSGVVSAPRIVAFDFDTPIGACVAHNDAVFFPGGVLTYFDGTSVLENGFLFSPSKPSTSSTGTGISGTFRYVAVYESIDALGNWCVSGVSEPSDPITVTDDTITVSTQNLGITNRLKQGPPDGTRVRVRFYRTLTGGEPPYYSLGTTDLYAGDPTIDFEDAVTDANLGDELLLNATGDLPGTNGAGQDRRQPPGPSYIASYNGMLVVSAGSEIWYSAQPVTGEGVWFSPAFTVVLDREVTGLVPQDGTLYPFTRYAVYAVAGEIPSDNGAQGGLGTPRRLTSHVGNVSINGTLATDQGIIFHSTNGLYRLLRGGQGAVPFSPPVQQTLDAYPGISAMELDARNGLARISLVEDASAATVTGDGRDLVYDLTRSIWVAVDRKPSDAPAQSAATIQVGGVWRYAWLSTAGVVSYERDTDDASAYLDGSTWITQRMVTGWIHIAGVQGEQVIDRILALAERHTAHDVTISIAFDYSDTFTSTKTFTAAQLTSARQWIDREVTQLQSQAIKVAIEDATPSSGSVGSGKGASWVTITLAGQPHRGPKRTSAAQRGGT